MQYKADEQDDDEEEDEDDEDVGGDESNDAPAKKAKRYVNFFSKDLQMRTHLHSDPRNTSRRKMRWRLMKKNEATRMTQTSTTKAKRRKSRASCSRRPRNKPYTPPQTTQQVLCGGAEFNTPVGRGDGNVGTAFGIDK